MSKDNQKLVCKPFTAFLHFMLIKTSRPSVAHLGGIGLIRSHQTAAI